MRFERIGKKILLNGTKVRPSALAEVCKKYFSAASWEKLWQDKIRASACGSCIRRQRQGEVEMTISFHYSGDISYLTNGERRRLREDLEECTRLRNWDYLDISSKRIECGGSYDDQNGYRDDSGDIETVLDKYDVDWSGGASESEYEPDWDKMPGGYDTLWA